MSSIGIGNILSRGTNTGIIYASDKSVSIMIDKFIVGAVFLQ